MADRNTALSLGKILAARLMLSGSIIYSEKQTQISMRLIETETGRIAAAVNQTYENLSTSESRSKKLSTELLEKLKKKYPLQGKVINVDGELVDMNIGNMVGVVTGQRYKSVVGDVIIEVISTQTDTSTAKVLQGASFLESGLRLKKEPQEQLAKLEQELAAGEKELSVKLDRTKNTKLSAMEKEIEETRQKKLAEMEVEMERQRLLGEEKLKRDQETNKSELKKWRESEKEKLASEAEEKENRRHLDVFYENLGKYYALVIGNNNYKDLPNLETASHDAKAVGQILKDKYGFRVNILLDATRSDILLALSNLRESLKKSDNLLVYYAGHGWLDQEGDEGYWLPVDATQDNQINWVSNSSITTSLKAILAKHVIIVADSCYSGKLARGLIHLNNNRTSNYLARISQKRSRTVLASGGLEPVADGGGKGNHSIFASSLLEILEENKDIIDGSELFSKIRRPVMVNSDQAPEYAGIRKAGHDGGDFLFVRRD